MAGGIIYLDVDDEITSAATRIRTLEGSRVAVVLPHGSRVATSRINFRLLARDALTHSKRLSIVASDPATRALAASAGLPVFASVAEYEASVPEGGGATIAATGDDPGAGRRSAAAGAAAGATLWAADDAADAVVGASDTGSATVGRATPNASGTSRAATAAGAAGAAGAAAAVSASPGVAPKGRAAAKPTVVAAADLPADPPVAPVAGVAAVGHSARSDRAAGRGIGRGGVVAGLAVLILAAIVGGVAAYLLLPSADATVTAREETIGPLTFTIAAATDVTAPDVDRGVVPAQSISVPVEVADTFDATGKRTELRAATGSVRFSNFDPTSSNTVARGSIVSTPSGVRFRTNSTITIPAATFVIPSVIPAEKSVKVTAVDQGPEGNVPPNSITLVPRGEEPLFLHVTNRDATSGGKRQEFPRVTQKDVDAATAALTTSLQSAFQAQIDDPSLASGGATVFPDTAILADPTWTTEPSDLVGKEVDHFDLGASATGTVTAVDAAPVQAIASTRLADSVDPGYKLVPESASVRVDDAVVSGSAVTFPVVATAKQVKLLDPAAIQAAILGKPEAEAKAILDGYGPNQLHLWPDWVTTVPTLDSRVVVVVQGPTASGGPGASPGASGGSSARPSVPGAASPSGRASPAPSPTEP